MQKRQKKKRRNGSGLYSNIRRQKKTVLYSLERDAKLETLLARVDNFIAGKHDNFEIATAYHKRCTVLSSLGRHAEALKASKKACLMLKKKALRLEKKAIEEPARRNRARETLVYCWLAIAIYAEGVEHEYLGRSSRAENLFAAAISVAKVKLGPQHATTLRLQRLTASEAPLQSKHNMSGQGTRKSVLQRRKSSIRKPNEQSLPDLAPAKALVTSAQLINRMETLLDERQKKRSDARKRELHAKKCEEALGALHAMGHRALFQLRQEKKELALTEPPEKLAPVSSSKAIKLAPTERLKPLKNKIEVKPLPPKYEVKPLLQKKGADTSSPIKVTCPEGNVFFSQEELDTVLNPVQQSMVAANECRAQFDRYPIPNPAGERYWQCIMDPGLGLQPGEAESVLNRLRDSLLELINQQSA